MTNVTRLLNLVQTLAYRLAIDPNLERFTFTVTEEIDFELASDTRQLIFHSVGLDIHIATIDSTQAAKAISYDLKAETVTFSFAGKLEVGSHTLRLQCQGMIGASLHGFYRSNYQYQGTERWLGVTQFEAVHAREAFVCIDEPAAKAVFNLSLILNHELTAISNSNVKAETDLGSGRKRIDFAPTPKMSTYLVAFLIGDFEYLESVTPEGVTIRAYATPGKAAQLEFALDVAAKTLSFYGDYFDIAYPLPKLDMIAVPDFASSAMENWGAVTYRETDLMVDPKQSSRVNKQRVAEVIAHELAHQWFGNLVTMAWWDDLWLNEGFATWVSNLAQDKLFPEWEIWTQFAELETSQALGLDALANTHPIQVTVEDPRQLDEIFDAISYAKGASIIHMLASYLGATAWRDGLRVYLKRHAYGNSVTDDLWLALGSVTAKPVQSVMKAWTKQSGYPVVTFANGRLNQHRFYASPAEAAKAATEPVWPIPVAVLNSNGTVSEASLFDAATAPSELLDTALKLNPGQAGFYRVAYSDDQIKDLTVRLTDGTIPVLDRYGLVSDVYAVASAGLGDTRTALTLSSALRRESHYVVWRAVSGGLNQLIALMPDGSLYDQAEAYSRWLVAPNLARLGWEPLPGESYFDALMRPLVIHQALRYGDQPTIAEARRRYDAHRGGQAEIDPDLRGAVYYAVARYGTPADFDALLERYRHEPIQQEKRRLLNALCSFRQPELVTRALELGLDTDAVRPQDTVFVLGGLLLNRAGRDQAWQFIQAHWDELLSRYGSGGHMLEHIVALTAVFSDQIHADDVESFFKAHPHRGLARPVAQSVESIRQKSARFDRDQAALVDFFGNLPS